MKAVLLVLLVACAPIYNVVTRRCPPTNMAVADTLIAIGVGALGALHWPNNHMRGGAEMAAGVAIFGTSSLAEVRGCAR